MVFQSGDNIHTAAPREKHKNPARHFQVFYQALSDPIPPYHTLHTLKHGYPFLDTLLTFKCKRWEETRPVLHRMEEFWWSFIIRLANPKTTGIMGSI